jgi:hypothetical protein
MGADLGDARWLEDVLMRLLVAACYATSLLGTCHAQAQANLATPPGQGALTTTGGGGAGLLGLGGGAPVTCTNCETLAHTIVNDALITAQWVTQLERMEQQLQQQIAIFSQISGLTNVNAMAAVLNQANNFNQMNSFGNVPTLLQGAGGGIGAGYQAANGNVLPVGSAMPLMNAVAEVYNQRAGSLATVQGISAQLLTNSNVILAGLHTLQQLIDGQPSTQMMLGINSRLAAHQGNINSQQYQLAQAQAFADAQQKVLDQKLELASFCSDYAWANSTHSLTGAGIDLGAARCTAVTGVVAAPVAAAPAPAPAGTTVAYTAGFDSPVTN